ncbi:hypothetical protein J19TS2_35830 [Cohnella xylanilytica]|uniref:hypothetical protein n=1 Tax=Cohnella xylanilytica TaxID=557555 RepID=UPI001B25E4F4|nr:hypothetical protein [Cohnella xylanilytica]GIO14028.1 hypothetical protein J19TS2_35830 [Cohnella xylanilytica]
MTTEPSWRQQCQEIQHACSDSDWSRVIQQCNELIRYAREQSGVAAATPAAIAHNHAQQTCESNEQQLQMHIQAHAEQD